MMVCAYAEHLRNLTLVSISRELRVRTKQRAATPSIGEQRVRETQPLASLRQNTDQQRKALRDHG